VIQRGAEFRLCIFARSPRLGAVKRRLAAEIGAGPALDAYRDLVTDTLKRLARVEGARTELWLAGPANAEVRGWLRRWQLPLRFQTGRDLGERMANALAACHDEGCRGVVVGTDCPPVTASYIRQAMRALDDHDVVLGPAQDGGYALVGTRAPVPAIFRDVPWGSAQVLDVTLKRIAAAGHDVALLETVWDVDSAGDLARFRRAAVERSGQPTPRRPSSHSDPH
jgi:rSAM/selenodomain-associated transferase 1